MTHVPVLPFTVSGGTFRHLELIQRVIFNGHAAVMVFFLISGFVIHLPYVGVARVPARCFWTRRLLRIVLPLVAVSLLAAVAELSDFPLFWNTGFEFVPIGHGGGYQFDTLVIWSLIAEMVYYLLYPLLHLIARRYGWPALVVVSYGVSWLIVSSQPHARVPGNFTNWLCWLVVLPPWLLGCLLAEWHSRKPAPLPKQNVWAWRAILIIASLVTKALSSPPGSTWPAITYSWTLPLFGLIAAFWLRREIAHFQDHEPLSSFERLGQATYSLYLIHIPVQNAVRKLLPPELILIDPIPRQLITLCSVFVLTAGFFWMVELPTWKFARMVSKRLAVSG